MNCLGSERTTENTPIIYILDCCRSEVALENRGLANLSNFQGDITNAFVMYATSSNKPASDGKGANGAFTELLLKHIDMDAEITSISAAIRRDLRERSKEKQVGARLNKWYKTFRLLIPMLASYRFHRIAGACLNPIGSSYLKCMKCF